MNKKSYQYRYRFSRMRNMIKGIKLLKKNGVKYLEYNGLLLLKRYDINNISNWSLFMNSYKYKRMTRDIRILSHFIASYFRKKINEK